MASEQTEEADHEQQHKQLSELAATLKATLRGEQGVDDSDGEEPITNADRRRYAEMLVDSRPCPFACDVLALVVRRSPTLKWMPVSVIDRMVLPSINFDLEFVRVHIYGAHPCTDRWFWWRHAPELCELSTTLVDDAQQKKEFRTFLNELIDRELRGEYFILPDAVAVPNELSRQIDGWHVEYEALGGHVSFLVAHTQNPRFNLAECMFMLSGKDRKRSQQRIEWTSRKEISQLVR